MRVLGFGLLLAVVCFTACSDSGKEPSEPVFEKTDIAITSMTQVLGYPNFNGIYENGVHLFPLWCGFNKDNECFVSDELRLTEDVYGWVEMYSGAEISYTKDYFVDDSGLACLTGETVPVYPAGVSMPDYARHCSLYFVAPDVGTFEFALKFWNPKTGKYYVTPRYRMRAWIEPDKSEKNVFAEITLVE